MISRKRFMTFAAIGAVGFAVDGGLLVTLLPSFGPYLGRAFSFAVAVSVTWGLNRHVTFRNEKNMNWRAELARYVSTQLIGALVNFAIYLAAVAAVPVFSRYPLAALTLGACGGLATNYLLARRVVFRRPTSKFEK